MSHYPVHVAFPGRLIMVGFGSIGQGVLPLILRHVGMKADQITILQALGVLDLQGNPTGRLEVVKAAQVAQTAAEGTAPLRPRIGRARPLADKSVGTPDAGAVSFALAMAAAGEALRED